MALLTALHAQLMLVRLSGSSVDSVDDIVSDLWAHIETLRQASSEGRSMCKDAGMALAHCGAMPMFIRGLLRMLAGLSFLYAVFSAAPVSAQTWATQGTGYEVYTPSNTVAPAPTDRRWYGWQTLLSDALSVGLSFASLGLGVPPIPALGLLFGAATIHSAHDNWTGLGISLGLRTLAGLFGFGAAISALTSDDEPGHARDGDELIVVAAITGLAAVVIDAAVLGYETLPPKQTSYGIAPWADARGSAGLQLMAAF